MAKRRRRKEKLKAKQRRQKELRPANRLSEAIELAQQGKFAKALPLAEAALSAANDDRTLDQASRVTGELHFRLAAQALDLPERLHHLEQGNALGPDALQARFAYHQGMTLLALHRFDAARTALTRARQLGATHESLAPALALAQQLDGQAPEAGELVPEQAQALAFLSALQQGKADAQQSATFVAQQPNAQQRSLWQELLQMRETPGASPLASLESAQSELDAELARPIVDYYVGVAALRRRDHETAVAAWHDAQAHGFNTPWFRDNQVYLLRQEIEELAEREEWATIVERLSGHSELETSAPLREHLAYAHFYLGEAQARAQQWQEAAHHWRQAHELNPSRYLAQNLALAEESLENWWGAAEAWRDLTRRRPRKENHPDYLDDEQVATVWKRASDCYEHVGDVDEQLTCLSKAIEYAPERLAWRMELVQLYESEARTEAAINELERILEIEAEHLPALLMLANLFDEEWGRNSIPIWQRALAVDPANLDARDGLAMAYTQQVNVGASGPFAQLFRDRQTGIKSVERGLQELPDHPFLLIEAGLHYLRVENNKKARAFLLQAAEAALKNSTRYLRVLDVALHELLHVDGDAEAEQLLPQVRALPGLRMTFWVSQGERVLGCELDPAWADRFWQEALAVAEQSRGDTPVLALAMILDAAAGEATQSDEPDIQAAARGFLQKYGELGAQLAPNSGIVAYAEATQGTVEQADSEKVKRLLRKARRQAEKAGESAFVEHIEEVELFLNRPSSLLSRLLELSGGELPELAGMPNLEELAELFGDLDDDFF